MTTILPGQKSYPNQSIVTIHKPQYKENFLQVSIDEWQQAYINLPAKSSFGLYLYLCGNQDTFNLWLSSADVQHALGISDSSYRRAVEDLLGEGYLIMRNGNPRTLDFYTTPQPTTYVKKERKKKKSSTGGRAAFVSDDAIPSEPPAVERQTYASASFSPYQWQS